MADLHFSGVDFRTLLDRLLLHACRRVFRNGILDGQVVRPFGKSPEDYVAEAVGRFLDPEDHAVQWSESRGKATTESVFAYLAQVVTNDIRDDVRGVPRRTTRTSIGSPTLEGHEQAPMDLPDRGQPTSADILDKIHRDRLFNLLLEGAKGDEELEEYLMLQYEAGDYVAYTPQRAAELLGTTVDNINNRKKRCTRLCGRFLEPPLEGQPDPPPTEGGML